MIEVSKSLFWIEMMGNFRTGLVCLLLLLVCACSGPRIDERYAATVVKQELSLPTNVTAKELHGGYSWAKLFVATDGSNQYVIKFIEGSAEREIYNSKVASDEGAGPKVYFADVPKGILIMEFLPGKITWQELQSDQLDLSLAHLLQTIHRGRPFIGGFDAPHMIVNQIQKHESFLPIARLGKIFERLQKTLTPHLVTTPCHNDLSPRNILLVGNQCKAIDYADAGQSDPYYDVASAVISVAFLNPARENLLFSTYLGHTPSSTEKAKLYLMKQVVWINWICNDVRNLPPEYLQKYDSVEMIPLSDYYKESVEGRFDLGNPTNRFMDLKIKLNILFANADSQEFATAVQLLSKQDLTE